MSAGRPGNLLWAPGDVTTIGTDPQHVVLQRLQAPNISDSTPPSGYRQTPREKHSQRSSE